MHFTCNTASPGLICELNGSGDMAAAGSTQRATSLRGLRPTGPTTGCCVRVKLVETASSKNPYFVEFYDVAAAPRYADLRSIFYGGSGGRGRAAFGGDTGPFHGVLFVHDLTNRRSFENMLSVWIPELVQGYHETIGGSSAGGPDAAGQNTAWAQHDRLQRRGTTSGWQVPADGSSLGDALIPDSSSGSGGGVGGGGKIEWHQALSTCPELPMLVVGVRTRTLVSRAHHCHSLKILTDSNPLGLLEWRPSHNCAQTKGELAGGICGGSNVANDVDNSGSPSKRAKVGGNSTIHSPRTSHGSLAQDAARLHPLALARASAIEGWLEPRGAVDTFLHRVVAQALSLGGGAGKV